jgi:hypothetical protein
MRERRLLCAVATAIQHTAQPEWSTHGARIAMSCARAEAAEEERGGASVWWRCTCMPRPRIQGQSRKRCMCYARRHRRDMLHACSRARASD